MSFYVNAKAKDRKSTCADARRWLVHAVDWNASNSGGVESLPKEQSINRTTWFWKAKTRIRPVQPTIDVKYSYRVI